MKKYQVRKGADEGTMREVDESQVTAYTEMGFEVIAEIEDEVITADGVGQSIDAGPAAAGTETPPPSP